MERCNFDSAVIKLLLNAAGIILTCTVVSIGIINMNQAKETAGITAGRISSYNKELSQSELNIYDGLVVRGSDVINFYKKYFAGAYDRNNSFIMAVEDSSGNIIYMDESALESIKTVGSSYYIKPVDKFIGKVIYNENDVITDVVFRQL